MAGFAPANSGFADRRVKLLHHMAVLTHYKAGRGKGQKRRNLQLCYTVVLCPVRSLTLCYLYYTNHELHIFKLRKYAIQKKHR